MASNSDKFDSVSNKSNGRSTKSKTDTESLKTPKHCSVDKPDKQGYTPLHRIYTKVYTPMHKLYDKTNIQQDVETIKMLVALGADVHTKAGDGSTIFHSAVKNNISVKLLECLTELQNKEGENDEPEKNKMQNFNFRNDVNCIDNHGNTPMHLLINKKGNADANDKAVLLLLMSLGADVNMKTSTSASDCTRGYTALMLAVYKLDVAMVQILINGNANVNAVTRQNQNAFIQLILGKSFHRRFDGDAIISIAKLLIEAGIDMDMENRNGETVLHLAIQSNQHEVVKLLLKQ